MPHIICKPCIGVKDGSCLKICPEDCIEMGETQYFINPQACTDCGLCIPECPISAIFPIQDVPHDYIDWINKNAHHFH